MNYFEHHEEITLVGLAIAPRLTLLIANFSTGGLLWWLGWIFAPHILIAILAIPFWDSNPILVCIACVMAFTGTNAETCVIKRSEK